MSMFDFFRRKKKSDRPVDKSQWTGKDFEFLITGNIVISENDFDKIMTPRSFDWTKIAKNEWTYYQVGQDEFSYSWEIPGIQMTFNESISYQKARRIADEVVENIRATGQAAELVPLDKTQVCRFE